MTPQRAILNALRSGATYGLELGDRVKRMTEGKIDLTERMAIYPILRDMERRGLLRSWEGESLLERGNRPRVYYMLTDDGAIAAEGVE